MFSTNSISEHLAVEHRAYVALYALQLCQAPRQAVLDAYDVTEADLAHHRAGWEELQLNHVDRNRPMPRIKLGE